MLYDEAEAILAKLIRAYPDRQVALTCQPLEEAITSLPDGPDRASTIDGATRNWTVNVVLPQEVEPGEAVFAIAAEHPAATMAIASGYGLGGQALGALFG